LEWERARRLACEDGRTQNAPGGISPSTAKTTALKWTFVRAMQSVRVCTLLGTTSIPIGVVPERKGGSKPTARAVRTILIRTLPSSTDVVIVRWMTIASIVRRARRRVRCRLRRLSLLNRYENKQTHRTAKSASFLHWFIDGSLRIDISK
jgi:hypothetical protein